MSRIMLLLGGNMGEVAEVIDRAVSHLEREVGEVVTRSEILRSKAWGFNHPTPDFLNQAVELHTSLTPEELLDATQRIEQKLGRERESEREAKQESGERYASRGIDIDIIFYGEQSYQSERLTIPHPLMQEREFVLRPIAEIAPEWQNVALGASAKELLERLKNEL